MRPGARYLVGTASWTDPTLVKSDTFYPPSLKTAEERLRFYAEQFNAVEVDSTFYALPSERNSKLWAERTPSGFVFNFKAFAWMTQHQADVARLPKNVREMLPAAQQTMARLSHPPRECLDLAFQMFWSALQPLRENGARDGGSLGTIVFTFPPYFVVKPSNVDYLASLPERLPGASIAIEFRHPSWMVEGDRRDETMSFLRAHGLTYVSVDAPRAPSIPPSFLAATGREAYVRFHGQNGEAWFKRNVTPAERFKYLYSEAELSDWADRIRALDVERAHVIFNNCYSNFGIMNATTMRQMLERSC